MAPFFEGYKFCEYGKNDNSWKQFSQNSICGVPLSTTCMLQTWATCDRRNHGWGTCGEILYGFSSARVSCVQRHMESRNQQGDFMKTGIWEPSQSLSCISCSWRQSNGWAVRQRTIQVSKMVTFFLIYFNNTIQQYPNRYASVSRRNFC